MVIFKKLKKHRMNIYMFIMNIINNLNNFINSNHVQAAHNKQKSRQNKKNTSQCIKIRNLFLHYGLFTLVQNWVGGIKAYKLYI